MAAKAGSNFLTLFTSAWLPKRRAANLGLMEMNSERPIGRSPNCAPPILFLPEQLRGHLRKTFAPHGELMRAVGGIERVLEVVRRQHLRKGLVPAKRRVLLAAADPEQFQFRVGSLGIIQLGFETAREIGRHAGTESGHRAEQVEMAKPDFQRLSAAH